MGGAGRRRYGGRGRSGGRRVGRSDGRTVGGNDRVARRFSEYWTFVKRSGVAERTDRDVSSCPSCAAPLDRVKSQYAGQIRLVYRQFPLSQIHPNALKAAEASLCAMEQGRFWELHDAMFAEQAMLAEGDLKQKAGRLGLDQAAFDACLDTGKFAGRVADDLSAGQRLGINGTPAVFVNGRPLAGGAVPFEMLAEMIEDELQRHGRD